MFDTLSKLNKAFTGDPIALSTGGKSIGDCSLPI